MKHRVYERESKKIKAKAIDSNTTTLDDKTAEQEVRSMSLPHAQIQVQPLQLPACLSEDSCHLDTVVQIFFHGRGASACTP